MPKAVHSHTTSRRAPPPAGAPIPRPAEPASGRSHFSATPLPETAIEAPARLRQDANDTLVLQIAANWRFARAQAMVCWADHDVKGLFGLREHRAADVGECINTMTRSLSLLATFEPKSARGAREVLRIAVEILAYREIDPEATLAEGPVLQILRNVLKASEWLDGNTPLGPEQSAEAA